jgi:hypothetical protein
MTAVLITAASLQITPAAVFRLKIVSVRNHQRVCPRPTIRTQTYVLQMTAIAFSCSSFDYRFPIWNSVTGRNKLKIASHDSADWSENTWVQQCLFVIGISVVTGTLQRIRNDRCCRDVLLVVQRSTVHNPVLRKWGFVTISSCLTRRFFAQAGRPLNYIRKVTGSNLSVGTDKSVREMHEVPTRAETLCQCS